ncbi:hypothetical protein PRZ48_008551 [Zasmidium cellare]|uniref:Uncharacterized protein n=1 Tax=Zasmidium cellare TaxID=395010 RepID=A0ABR0EFU2_ZASCE|nr:hypothetical protein PRZ48_008551 [Zasmidium cellare]
MTSLEADKTAIETRYREYCNACQSGHLEKLTEFWSLPASFTVDFGGPDSVCKIVEDPAELEKLYSTEFGSSTGVDKTTIDTSEVTFFGERLATIETTLRHTVKGELHDRQHATETRGSSGVSKYADGDAASPAAFHPPSTALDDHPLGRACSTWLRKTQYFIITIANKSFHTQPLLTMSGSVKCTIHLLSLKKGADLDLPKIISTIQTNDLPGFLIRGIPYGWVHKPHTLDRDPLLTEDWNFFFLTKSPELYHGGYVAQFIERHVSVTVDIPKTQADALEEKAKRNGVYGLSQDDMPKANPKTPALPVEWGDPSSPERKHKIPKEKIVDSKSTSLRPGELYLDDKMAQFLSTAEPDTIRGKPICFFNLFKYANGDRSVHDSYMNGFKEKFGPDAGAEVKFMGPVQDRLGVNGSHGDHGQQTWDDANLVQYDSIWHYAYMLSTDVYQELNQEKMRGLEDTCILLISEVGWQESIPKIPSETITLK